jgi:hypothetical protein
MDLDHTIAYRPPVRGGPPGQTGVATLGPLSNIASKRTADGEYANPNQESGSGDHPTTPITWVTNSGTYNLGEGRFARRVWHAAAPPDVTGHHKLNNEHA